MAGATPKTKSAQLTDRINLMGDTLKSGGVFDEMSWQRIRREAESLEAVPEQRAIAILLLAILWEMRLDREKTLSYLNRYIANFGKSHNWYMTRANMAPTLGDASLVTDMLENSYPKGNKAELAKVISICHHSGMFASARKALEDVRQLDEKLGFHLESAFPYIIETSDYLVAHDIPELRVATRVAAASKVLVEEKISLTRYVLRADEFGMSFEFVVDNDVDVLAGLELKISEALAEGFEDTLSNHLSVGVTPKEEVA